MDPYVQVAATMAVISAVFLLLLMIARGFQDKDKNE